jgi:hypothetical protein
MTEGTALVEIGNPNELAEGGPLPCFFSGRRGTGGKPFLAVPELADSRLKLARVPSLHGFSSIAGNGVSLVIGLYCRLPGAPL